MPIHVVHVGGNANNAANAGTFTLNSNNASSNSNRNIGTHLAGRFIPEKISCSFAGEYVNPIQFGRGTEELGVQQR
jgi:hypothetical protein